MNKQVSFATQPRESFAEIIESSLATFTAQCWQWDQMPYFGSLVSVQNAPLELFGVVSHIQTGSMDPMRYPFPYQKTEEELRSHHPQIFEFLKTTFQITIIGYKNTTHKFSAIRYNLPPQPAKIHAFVSQTTPEILPQVFANPDFLPLIFAASSSPQQTDELLLALLAFLADQHALKKEYIEKYYHTISLLTGNDYRRLKLLMQRINIQHSTLLNIEGEKSTT